MIPIRIVLDRDDFERLVSGGTVERDGAPEVRIILQDIGYDEMLKTIAEKRHALSHKDQST